MTEGVRGQTAWLRIYLGYAPGVGKTHAMLLEGQRLGERGTDVVIGWVEAYDRPLTLEAIGQLEIVPSRKITHRGVLVEEMDVDAILARRPQLALVDELAHHNVVGAKHQKRYQDVTELRDSGISVLSTLNIQQLASLQDTIRLVAGVAVSETLPDWVLDSADDLRLIDAPPEVLQKRLRRGNVLPREQIAPALEGYFRTNTLTALRELTLRRIAEHSRLRLRESADGASMDVRPTSETVLVCLPASNQAQVLLGRGVHLADVLEARLVVLHVAQPGRGLYPGGAGAQHELSKALQLARALGADVHIRNAPKVAEALVEFAAETGATQVVLGESSHSRVHELFRGSVLREVLRRTRDMDVHIVRRAEA